MCQNIYDISPLWFFIFNFLNIYVVLIGTFQAARYPDTRNADGSDNLLPFQAILSPDADPPVLRLFDSEEYKYERYDKLAFLCHLCLFYFKAFLLLPS